MEQTWYNAIIIIMLAHDELGVHRAKHQCEPVNIVPRQIINFMFLDMLTLC